jgi:hypothetical protein
MMARGSMVSTLAPTARMALAGAMLVATACSRGSDAMPKAPAETTMAITAAPLASCGHAICADNFFIDATVPDCVAGSPCSAAIKVVATGDFHINDEYPYRFRADDAPGVDFLGTDPAGKSSFSKGAGDWQKSEEKAGAMNVKFSVADRGTKTIGGTLKLSVCSVQNCLLEQRPVTVSVLVK